MQLINQNSNNSIYLTLTERVTLSNPYFLMRVRSRSTNQVKTFILASNLSSYTGTYDQFTITESTTEVLTSGTVNLTPGDWWYEVYEQASSSNLNIDATGTKLEEGILRVVQTPETFVSPNTEESFIYPD